MSFFAGKSIYWNNRRYKFQLLLTPPAQQQKRISPQGDTLSSITSLPNPTHAPAEQTQHLIHDVPQRIMPFEQGEALH